MKTIILVRHAKAKDAFIGQKDFDRTLSEKGQKDIVKSGRIFEKLNLKPELILCSQSIRTRMTLDLLNPFLGKNSQICYPDEIYENNTSDILKLIAKQNDNIERILIVGHNPSMQELTEILSEEGFPYDNFGTGNISIITLSINKWNKIKDAKGELKYLISPKQ